MKPLKTIKSIHYVMMSSKNDGERFYCKLGRFFCSKKVTDEIGGYQVVDDPNRLWVVAFEGGSDSMAVGFCSFTTEMVSKRIINLCDSYVSENFRRCGIYSRMFEFRENEALSYLSGGGRLKGIATAVSEPMFLKHGYHKKSQRGRFAYMEKEIK